MGNREFSALYIIHLGSVFHSSFSIILIISIVRWVAQAEKKAEEWQGIVRVGGSGVVGIWKQWRYNKQQHFQHHLGSIFRKREEKKKAQNWPGVDTARG